MCTLSFTVLYKSLSKKCNTLITAGKSFSFWARFIFEYSKDTHNRFLPAGDSGDRSLGAVLWHPTAPLKDGLHTGDIPNGDQ